VGLGCDGIARFPAATRGGEGGDHRSPQGSVAQARAAARTKVGPIGRSMTATNLGYSSSRFSASACAANFLGRALASCSIFLSFQRTAGRCSRCGMPSNGHSGVLLTSESKNCRSFASSEARTKPRMAHIRRRSTIKGLRPGTGFQPTIRRNQFFASLRIRSTRAIAVTPSAIGQVSIPPCTR
jgi:hypothetical protein